MKASVFVDLDHTLVHSYSPEEAERYGIHLADTQKKYIPTHQDLVSRLRPGATEFLIKANEVAHVYLFTAAQLGYAREVLEKFHLFRYFSGFYTTVFSTHNSIGSELSLRGSPWMLVDDSDPCDKIAKYKFRCLGLTQTQADNPEIFLRHYARVEPFLPHRGIVRKIDDMEKLAREIQPMLKSLGKKMIKH